MSKETTPTTTDQWTPDFSHAAGNTPKVSHKVEGTYAFITEDLVESRMVINPSAKLVTEGQEPSLGDQPAGDPAVGTAETPVVDPAYSTTPETTAPTAPVVPSAETAFTSEKRESLLTRVRGKLGTLAERLSTTLHEFESKIKNERIKRGLGAAAIKLFSIASKNKLPADSTEQKAVSDEDTEKLEKTFPTIFREKARERREKDSEPREGRIRSSLGNAATWLRGMTKRKTEVVHGENDGAFKRFGNHIKNREAVKDSVRTGLAKSALGVVLVGGIAAGLFAGNSVKATEHNGSPVLAGVAYGIKQTEGVDTTAIMVGGNYQNRPTQDLVDQGLEQGVNVEGLDWVSEMGPIAGKVDAKVSLNDGATALEKRMGELVEMGQQPEVVAYSWGTVATAEAYHRIKQSDPELYSKLKPPVLYGSPLGSGAFEGPFGPIAMKVLGVDPAILDSLPEGTTFVYSDRDPYATSGDGQQPLSAGFNVLMMAVGSHERQDEENAYITVKDDKGNFHKITKFDAAAALGIKGAGNAELNAAIDKMFPMNMDPDSKVRPKADAIGAIFFGAQALDKMIDPSGNTKIFQKIQEQIPQEWKKLLGDGVNGMNDTVSAVMEAANNPTPENIQAAFSQVMATMGMISGDMQSALNRNVTTDVKNGGVTVMSQLISENFGMDYNTVHNQLNTFVGQLEQNTYAASVKASASNQINVQIQKPAPAPVPTVTSIPKPNAPTVTLNTGAAAPTNTYNGNNGPASIPSFNLPPATVTTSPEAPKPVVAEPQPAVAPAAPQEAQPIPLAPAPAEVATPPTPPAAPVEAAPAAPAAAPAPQGPNILQNFFDQLAPAAPAPAPAPSAPAAPAPASVAPTSPTAVIDVAPQAPVSTATSSDPDLAPAA